jgi:nitroimidazol reductase NimA-like FMN-containing flavoprotein (pyridoxamine 5'-phosphate oxidase superfamily)
MSKQDISFVECIELLKAAEYGYLAMSMYNQPYVIPVNYYYDDSEKIYIHTGPEGQKMDYLSFNPTVCLAVSEAGAKVSGNAPCSYTYPFWSVLVYGTTRIIAAGPEKKAALEKLIDKYRDGEITPLTDADLEKVVIIEIEFKEIFGRRNTP